MNIGDRSDTSPARAAECSIRVFLVDDHRIVLWGLEKLIESAKPRMTVVGQATNVRDALNEVHALVPDLVLLDLDLGGENGMKFIEGVAGKLKSKVLVLTRLRDPSLHEKAIVAGARGVVTTLESPQEILLAIEKVHDGEFWIDRMTTTRILDDLAHAGGQHRSNPERRRLSLLTRREREVMRILLENSGAPAKKVASLLNISSHTLRHHCTAIYEKMGVSSRLQLIFLTQQHGLTAPHQGTAGPQSMTADLEEIAEDDRGMPVV